MTITVKEIRERFPNPMKACDDTFAEGEYCVGGAFCRAFDNGRIHNFPARRKLAEYLRAAVPHLVVWRSDEIAEAVIKANDIGDFEAAWKALEEALSYGRAA